MSKQQKEMNMVKHTTELPPKLLTAVRESIVVIRDIPIIVDADVANLYGVETKRVNEAVRNNPDKFPEDYMFILSPEEATILRSKFSTTKLSPKSRTLPKAFTEKGLYMLATILKSKSALNVTFAIIETFTQVRNLKRERIKKSKIE
ncbi:MAG: ORF6N domain-containing protein [Odoribacter sp.]|nr:ORF6N domain-containing protein [Odoribacter sp.]